MVKPKRNFVDVFSLIMNLLRNFPSIVLDSREIIVPPQGFVSKKRPYTTVTGDFDVTIGIKNKLVSEKKYKVITFITDL